MSGDRQTLDQQRAEGKRQCKAINTWNLANLGVTANARLVRVTHQRWGWSYKIVSDLTAPAPDRKPERKVRTKPGRQPPHSFDDIFKAVEQVTGINRKDILARVQQDHIRAARFIVYTLARDRGISFSAIGRACQRNHTTIIDAVARAEGHLPGNPDLAAKLEQARRAAP